MCDGLLAEVMIFFATTPFTWFRPSGFDFNPINDFVERHTLISQLTSRAFSVTRRDRR
jgi:hypothetical protein